MRRKKDAFKKWQMQGGNEQKEAYKNTKREREREREKRERGKSCSSQS